MEKFKILIVEDEHDIRELYRDLLTDQGFEVLEAPDGVTGLRLAKESTWDLMLLDIMLPQVDGLRVLEEIRQKFSNPILIISNLNNDDIITKSMDLGSNGYVIKSELNPAQFITEVKKYLNIL
jgi:DNA-binding response OmpR family regulator